MKETYEKYGSIILITFILFLSYIIVRPFILPIATAAVIAYIFHPIFNFFHSRTNKKNLSAFLVCLLVLIIVVLPFYFVLNSLVREIPAIYSWISSTVQSSQIYQSYIYETLKQDFGMNIDIGKIVGSLSTSLLGYIQSVLTALPGKLLSSSIAAFFLFFFLRDGYDILRKILHYLPFPKKESLILLRELKQMMDAVVYGQLITALAQAIVATIAYYVLGISAPLFWGIMTFIFSLIPMVGPSLIYMPLSISMVVLGINGDSFLIVKGIILAAYGIGIVSTVDNIIKPLVISDKVRMHPALVFIGVIGGISAFGVIGIVLGPLILVFLVTLFNLYEMREDIIDHIEHPKR